MTDGTYTDLFGNVCRWKDLPAPERKAKYKPDDLNTRDANKIRQAYNKWIRKP